MKGNEPGDSRLPYPPPRTKEFAVSSCVCVCVCVCVCQRGLLDVAKFYFYLLFGDDLNTLCCQSISRKKPAWLLSAKRIKVIFFP